MFQGRMVIRGIWGLGPCPLRAEWLVIFWWGEGLRLALDPSLLLFPPSKVLCKSGAILGFQLVVILDFYGEIETSLSLSPSPILFLCVLRFPG